MYNKQNISYQDESIEILELNQMQRKVKSILMNVSIEEIDQSFHRLINLNHLNETIDDGEKKIPCVCLPRAVKLVIKPSYFKSGLMRNS